MKVSMHNWMRAEPLEVTVARLARCGYDAIEISGEPARYQPQEVRPLLERHGIRCCGSVTLMTDGRDLISPDPSVRESSVQYIRDCLSMVHELGGEFLCVVPSTVGKTQPLADAEQEWAWAVESLSWCAEWADRQQVRMGIEPINRFETYFINRGDQALALADAVGAPNVGVVLDAFHINIEEADPLGAIRQAGPRLVDFHVADNNRKPPGEGALDWRRIIGTLHEIGYDGYLSSEFVLPMDRSPLGAREYGDPGVVGVSEDKFLRDHASGDVSADYYDRCVERTIAHLRQYLVRG
jgi:D-psicose/D-tagatose/L-ribulose 3-epimerase